jgi:glutathione synthase/RimK-type ligase-like ATP-grasp enzyme
VRILLTEGAGLTSRQVATRLDQLGHDVSVAVSDPICLARFTRRVHSLLRVPEFGRQPLVWFDQLLAVAERARIDVIFPTQEQVAVLSHQLPRLTGAGLVTAVPSFAALSQVQDKVSAHHTLRKLGISQPRSVVVQDPAEAAGWSSFPAYVKAPVGTGSTGVRRVEDRSELDAAIRSFVAAGALDDGGVLVQEMIEGMFAMAQSVFDAGELVAFHAVERVREGANGSASAKTSVDVPRLRQELAQLGQALHWHGALSVDAIVVNARPYIIDVNARLVEPANAIAAGTDLVSALLAVAIGSFVAAAPPSQVGVRTHQLLMGILGVAQRTGRRRRVLAEVVRGVCGRGDYANSVEELLPWQGDRRTLILPVAAALATLPKPGLWRVFTDGAVSRYALTSEGWRLLRATAPLSEVTPTSA